MSVARHLLAVLAVLGLQAAAGATDLEVKFDQGRWAQLRANPRRATDLRRGTRSFQEVLRPDRVVFAPKLEDRVLLRDVRGWEDRTGLRNGPEVAATERWPSHRALWLRFQLWKVPRTALVHRAELRLAMSLGDLQREAKWPTEVHLDMADIVPVHLRKAWTEERMRPPAVRVQHNYPTMWWDVTRFVQVGQQEGDLWRSLSLVLDNAGHLGSRRPELHVWYTLPLEATAE